MSALITERILTYYFKKTETRKKKRKVESKTGQTQRSKLKGKRRNSIIFTADNERFQAFCGLQESTLYGFERFQYLACSRIMLNNYST